ncbi:MAG TPA: hypothetical protein VIX86_12745 [Streptosporangiaceae bacterium]
MLYRNPADRGDDRPADQAARRRGYEGECALLAVSRKAPAGRHLSLGYRLVGVEVCADPQGFVGCFHADHACEQPQVVDVAGPGGQGFHREDVLG